MLKGMRSNMKKGSVKHCKLHSCMAVFIVMVLTHSFSDFSLNEVRNEKRIEKNLKTHTYMLFKIVFCKTIPFEIFS